MDTQVLRGRLPVTFGTPLGLAVLQATCCRDGFDTTIILNLSENKFRAQGLLDPVPKERRVEDENPHQPDTTDQSDRCLQERQTTQSVRACHQAYSTC